MLAPDMFNCLMLLSERLDALFEICVRCSSCSKSIDIRVDVAIVTTCVIYVDERVSPFLDYLGPHTTSYSNSRTYKTVKLLVVSFPLSS